MSLEWTIDTSAITRGVAGELASRVTTRARERTRPTRRLKPELLSGPPLSGGGVCNLRGSAMPPLTGSPARRTARQGTQHEDQKATGFAGSPLTQKLDAVYGNPSDLYAALMLHLHSLLEGNAQSLATLPFDKAWRKLAAAREGAIERASLYMEARTAITSQHHPNAAANLPQEPELGLR